MMGSTDEAPLFDPVAIEALRKVAGDQASTFVAELAGLFFDETTKALLDLRSGCDHDDWRTVSRLAHSLKSSSATLGLMRLSRVSRALELDTQTGASSPQTESLVAAVADEFRQAIPILKRLSGPPA